MLFNSYEFIFIFLPITFCIYFYLLNRRLLLGAKGFLVFSSLFFYSWWNIIYLPLILVSMLFNYIIGNSLNKDNHNKRKGLSKKTLLSIGIVANIFMLVYFKYADFFIENINYLVNINISHLNLILPLAISFFTFQQIAYLVDSYKCQTKEYDFLNYALFVTFFPQLIAGPIVHHKEMMPQFANRFNLIKKYKNINLGFFIFSIGLFKKVVIADTLAVWANNGFDKTTILNFIEAWVTSLSYTFQLYFDFSGYTDMAVGVALLFNIKLPVNFNSPYKALSIQDFWRRWHITLSRFLRDYIYIPLGGNQKGNFRIYSNLLITFVIGGLWHGAGWTFIFWGFLHGLALIINRIWQKIGFNMWKWLAWLITFNFVNIAWIFFRAKEWDDAIKVLRGMFGFTHEVGKYYDLIKLGTSFKDDFLIWLIVFLLSCCIIFLKNSNELLKTYYFKYVFFSAFLFVFAISSFEKVSQFLYFNF